MRYHYEKPPIYLSMYGKLYICNHPVYDSCTLYKIDEKGLAVIQQRYDVETKVHGGAKSIRGLLMKYIYILILKAILNNDQKSVLTTDYIQRLQFGK